MKNFVSRLDRLPAAAQTLFLAAAAAVLALLIELCLFSVPAFCLSQTNTRKLPSICPPSTDGTGKPSPYFRKARPSRLTVSPCLCAASR